MTPHLSVVIPTLGVQRALASVLQRLRRQRRAPDFEVLVVADADAANRGEISRVLAQGPEATRLLDAATPGASAARNVGWREASAEVVLFLGDDILPGAALLAEHADWHRRFPEAEVGVLGHVRWARQLRVTPFMRWLAHGPQFRYAEIRGVEAGWGHFYTANASVKREMLERVGGFDEERLPFLYEDVDLAYRMSRQGFRLLYNRRAIAEHLHPVDVEGWRRRVRQVAAAERAFVELHPEVEPHFLGLFEAAASRPPARGRGRFLLGLVPRGLPWLGPFVWESADLYYLQALAADFLDAWERARVSPPGRAHG